MIALDLNAKIRDLLASANAVRDALLAVQEPEQLTAVQDALRSGAALAVEVTYPRHGIRRVALALVAQDGKRIEIAGTEPSGGGLN